MEENPDPICPCGAWFNFTCHCTSKEVMAFKLGRAWEARAAEERLSSVHSAMTAWVGDWSEDRIHAWIYGVIVGWDDASLAELVARFGWHSEDVERLKTLMPKDRNDV